MTVQDIEKELMKLDVMTRAKLASRLLESLDELSVEENEKLWTEEALRRHEAIIKGKAKSRKAHTVINSAKARFK